MLAAIVRPSTPWWILACLLALISPVAAQAAATSQPLAEVDGVPITAEEVEKALAPEFAKLQEQMYEMRRQQLEALIQDRLLAKESAKRGVTVSALLDAEVTSKVGLVTEQEIESFYQANRARIPGAEATVRDQIRAYLQNQKLAARRAAFLESLRTQASVVVRLQPPPVSRLQVPVEGAPFRGAPTAQVTIVEFQDFHCPFCQRVQPTLNELLTRYPGKLKLVYRDFPIDSLHPGARKAHEAARCANDQGKFWAYHDRVFANPPNSSPEQLKGYAEAVGLDLPAFEECLRSEKYRAAVQQDEEAGIHLGVNSTPTFFINGRLFSGAQPLENFVRVIEDELSRTR
ncbi:MAG TPA: thioredoxin domain-containing protein [Candidatus Acidoferrum sp.]|nr:thioredoxin domain-containing protein [Candidatus Acidoferrum sp.]